MIINLNESNDGVFETKWGFVSYSYENYKKLKRINFILQKTKSAANRWKRWVRKDPHNRVYKTYTRNEKGQKTGYVLGDRIPEPKVCEDFCTKVVDIYGDSIPGVSRYVNGKYVEHITTHSIFKGKDIITEYQIARFPRNKKDLIKAGFTTDDVNELLLLLENWYESTI